MLMSVVPPLTLAALDFHSPAPYRLWVVFPAFFTHAMEWKVLIETVAEASFVLVWHAWSTPGSAARLQFIPYAMKKFPEAVSRLTTTFEPLTVGLKTKKTLQLPVVGPAPGQFMDWELPLVNEYPEP